MVEPLKAIRYILFVSILFVMFSNLIDCISQNSGVLDYVLYVLILLVIAILLIFIKSNWILAVIFSVAGIFTILDIPTPNYISGGVFFFIFSIRIVDNKIFSCCIYFLTAMMVIAAHAKNAKSPLNAVNILVAYAVIYLIDYLLYNNKKRYIG